MPDVKDPLLEFMNQRPAPGPMEEAMNYANAVAMLRALKPEVRLDVMNQFCKHCGSDDPRCQCCNDE